MSFIDNAGVADRSTSLLDLANQSMDSLKETSVSANYNYDFDLRGSNDTGSHRDSHLVIAARRPIVTESPNMFSNVGGRAPSVSDRYKSPATKQRGIALGTRFEREHKVVEQSFDSQSQFSSSTHQYGMPQPSIRTSADSLDNNLNKSSYLIPNNQSTSPPREREQPLSSLSPSRLNTSASNANTSTVTHNGSSKAVLAALKALQDKIKRLETEKGVLEDEVTHLKDQARVSRPSLYLYLYFPSFDSPFILSLLLN